MVEFYLLVKAIKGWVAKFSIILGILSLFFANCFGATYTYTGANNGSWTTPSNWSGGSQYPGYASGDAAIINSSVNINVGSALANSISTLTVNTGYTATVTVSSGLTLALTGTLTIGSGSPAYFTITGTGAATLSGISFGYQSTFTIGSSGVIGTTVTLNSGSTMLMGNNNNAFTNYGTFTINSSTITMSGGPATFVTSGTVNLNSGSTINITNNNCYITNTGTFTSTGTSGSPVTINYSSSAGSSNLNNYSPGIFNATYTNLTFQAGSSNTINNTGTFTATLSPTFTLGYGSTIMNTGGSFTLNGCPVTMAQNASIRNSSAGSCTLQASSGTVTTVSFGYGSYITNSGAGSIFNAGTSNSQCVLNVSSQTAYITNSGTVTTHFYLGSTSIINLTGVSSILTNTSPAICTLQSDQYGSAAIGALASTASCSGTFNVERYYQGGATKSGSRWVYRNYRIISSPVNTGTQIVSGSGNYYISGLNYIVGATAGQTTAANSTTNAFVMGAAGGSSSSGNPSLFLYRESITPSNTSFTSGNFIGITNITSASAMYTSDGATTTTIPAGNGVFFFYRGNASNFATRTTSPYIAPENTTLTATGTLNQQGVLVKNWYSTSSATLGYTGSGAGTNSAVRGFNMVGNPYACSIDWNTAYSGSGITRTNVNPTIWVFNPFTNQYDTYITTSTSTGTSNGGGTDGSGYATKIIASGQGFFVQASAASPALTFTESAKSPTSQVTGSYLLMGAPPVQSVAQLLRLRMVQDSLDYDDITIGFNSTASSKYNGNEDAEYLPGVNAAVGLSSLSSDSLAIPLSINFLPLPKQTPQVIRLSITAAKSGAYTFQKTELDAIPQIYGVWLMDKFKKDSLDLRSNSTYGFSIDLTDTASFGNNRFSIVIRQNPQLGVRLLNFTATKTTSGNQIIWKTENEQNYTNFTVERSIDNGNTFNVLGGFVSNALGTYSLTDKNPQPNTNKYRLKIEDINGTITYSNVVTLDYSNGDNSAVSNINVYPNPATNYINLAITPKNSLTSNLSALQALNITPGLANHQNTNMQSYSIKIISITGTIIKTVLTSLSDWRDNVSGLTPGTYIIQVTNNNDNSIVGKSTFVKL